MSVIDIITPTRDRPVGIQLCKTWLGRQEDQDFRWIVADDGDEKADLSGIEDTIHIKRQFREGELSFIENLIAGVYYSIYESGSEYSMIVEDDDWFSPNFVRRFKHELDSYDVVSINGYKQYNVRFMKHFEKCRSEKGYRDTRKSPGNIMGFNSKARQFYLDCLIRCRLERYMFVDHFFWSEVYSGRFKSKIIDDEVLYVQLKAVPGKYYNTERHVDKPKGAPDPNGSVLESLVGTDDAKLIMELCQSQLRSS